VAEQDKLRDAELVVFQFPLWWYGPPAILKGRFDRVLVSGYAFGLVDPATGWVRKFGDGGLAGRRALAVVAAGDRPGALAERGISGHIEDVLWPMLRGTFHYTGSRSPLSPMSSGCDYRGGAGI
jgi:NAD(P)H dehydrogenase (quinone)